MPVTVIQVVTPNGASAPSAQPSAGQSRPNRQSVDDSIACQIAALLRLLISMLFQRISMLESHPLASPESMAHCRTEYNQTMMLQWAVSASRSALSGPPEYETCLRLETDDLEHQIQLDLSALRRRGLHVPASFIRDIRAAEFSSSVVRYSIEPENPVTATFGSRLRPIAEIAHQWALYASAGQKYYIQKVTGPSLSAEAFNEARRYFLSAILGITLPAVTQPDAIHALCAIERANLLPRTQRGQTLDQCCQSIGNDFSLLRNRPVHSADDVIKIFYVAPIIQPSPVAPVFHKAPASQVTVCQANISAPVAPAPQPRRVTPFSTMPLAPTPQSVFPVAPLPAPPSPAEMQLAATNHSSPVVTPTTQATGLPVDKAQRVKAKELQFEEDEDDLIEAEAEWRANRDKVTVRSHVDHPVSLEESSLFFEDRKPDFDVSVPVCESQDDLPVLRFYDPSDSEICSPTRTGVLTQCPLLGLKGAPRLDPFDDENEDQRYSDQTYEGVLGVARDLAVEFSAGDAVRRVLKRTAAPNSYALDDSPQFAGKKRSLDYRRHETVTRRPILDATIAS